LKAYLLAERNIYMNIQMQNCTWQFVLEYGTLL